MPRDRDAQMIVLGAMLAGDVETKAVLEDIVISEIDPDIRYLVDALKRGSMNEADSHRFNVQLGAKWKKGEMLIHALARSVAKRTKEKHNSRLHNQMSMAYRAGDTDYADKLAESLA